MIRLTEPSKLMRIWWLACLAPSWLLAVGTTGTIIGTVTSQDGRPVPDAVVEIRQQETGVTRITRSNELGQYSAPLLPPGAYQVNADAPSFRRTVAENVQV